MSRSRFAFYGRLSTKDKQDPALSFPSQLKACEAKVAQLGGEITCEFTDQESGAKADRPGWSALTAEARGQETRRFDAVVIYQTSRLSRDRLHAALFERELRNVGVAIHYAIGGGDPDTPEGSLMIGMQQLWDEFEREKLARETRRGMREVSEQGFRAGGRAPYGYRRVVQELPDDHKGDRSKGRASLEPHPDQAPVISEIFRLFTTEGLSPKKIAERLNEPGGPDSPSHVDSSRNPKGLWAASSIRAMLKNPVYTGRIVWNRLDFTEAKKSGGGARTRAKEDWVVTKDAHLPLVSDDIYEAAQARFARKVRSPNSAQSKRFYLLSGMVRCCAGHQPLSMNGKARKGHHYYACPFSTSYGDEAAIEAHGGTKWVYVREDKLERMAINFFEQRVFGPMRIKKLEKQIRAEAKKQNRDSKLTGTRMRQQVDDIDRKIKAQVLAIEEGVEPEVVSERIAELKETKETLQAALAELGAERQEEENAELLERLESLPDLTESLRTAPPEVRRQVFEAFDLKIAFDNRNGHVEISAAVTEEVAKALSDSDGLLEEGALVTLRDIAGAGFEPATFGL